MKRRSFFIAMGLFIIVVCSLAVFSITFHKTEPIANNRAEESVEIKQRRRVPDYGRPKRREIPSNESLAQIKAAFKKLRQGQIGFKTPAKMKVNEAELVEVHISDDLQRNLKSELGDKAEVFQTKISDLLKVTLYGINFDIKPMSPKNRFLSDGNLAKWHWEVIPKKSGEQTLILKVYARVRLGDESEELEDLETFKRTIKVTVSKSNWLKQNWISITEMAIALSSAGFFAFIMTKWKLVKNIVKKCQQRWQYYSRLRLPK